jgi:hypothetical protein
MQRGRESEKPTIRVRAIAMRDVVMHLSSVSRTFRAPSACLASAAWRAVSVMLSLSECHCHDKAVAVGCSVLKLSHLYIESDFDNRSAMEEVTGIMPRDNWPIGKVGMKSDRSANREQARQVRRIA